VADASLVPATSSYFTGVKENSVRAVVKRSVQLELTKRKELHHHPSTSSEFREFEKNRSKLAQLNKLLIEENAMKALSREYESARKRYRELLYLSGEPMTIREDRGSRSANKVKSLKMVKCMYGVTRKDREASRKIVIDGMSIMCT
jgi:hypothetical protein